MKTDVLESKIISFQDFNPFHKQERAVYTQHSIQKLIVPKIEKVLSLEEQLQAIESNEETYSYNLTDETYVLVKIEKQETPSPENSAVTATGFPTTTQSVHSQSINYIVGCFSDEANASNLVDELKAKGFNAFIKDKKGGLNRVSIGSSDSQEVMNQLISKANASGYSGWILK